MCIRDDRGIYRGKIADDSDRRLLLSKVSNLKGSIFGRIFIHRDLTYIQRQELFNRRRDNSGAPPPNAQARGPAPAAAAAVEGGGSNDDNGEDGASDVATPNAPNPN